MSNRDDPFREYADRYDDTVQEVIGASGESVQFFADIKAALVQEMLGYAPSLRVLDFGCGTGNTTRALAAALPQAEVVGIDVSAASVIAARQNTTDAIPATFVCGGFDGLPFKDSVFDVVFASCVFHHIDRAEHSTWMGELVRVLASRGRLFIFEHNPLNPLTLRVVRNCPFDRGVVLLHPSYTHRLLSTGGVTAHRLCFYFFFPHVLRFLRPLERYLRWLPLGAQYFVVAERQ